MDRRFSQQGLDQRETKAGAGTGIQVDTHCNTKL